MDPVKLAFANAFFDNVQKGDGAIDGLIDTAWCYCCSNW